MKNTINKKCIVLIVSIKFMSDHPCKGEDTDFPIKIVNQEKLHTIRSGNYWRNVVDKVNAGTHYLSLRYWSGKPYCSKQVEFTTFEKLGYQEIKIYKRTNNIKIDNTQFGSSPLFFKRLANNDGLSFTDFYAWFGMHKKSFKGFEGGIIHFTDFRY